MFTNDIGITIVVTTLLILLLIAGVIVTMVLSNRRHVQQQVRYEQELRLAEQEIQEKVLVDIGQELHDNIGQLLTVMNLQLELQKVVNPTMAAGLVPITESLVNTINEVRGLSKRLNSDLLETNGLLKTIELEVGRVQQLGQGNVHWTCDTEPKLDKNQRVIVFRIFQEMLNNTLKHAAAKNICIILQGENLFKLVVRDDGKGFDLGDMMRSAKGAGLKNMTKRAELAKLKCKIDTVPGKGTTYTLE